MFNMAKDREVKAEPYYELEDCMEELAGMHTLPYNFRKTKFVSI